MLTINLTAIQNNWLKIKGLASLSRVASVIKANAYGLGAYQIGSALYDAGCREFFVANFDEAVAAKEFLPNDCIIYVLGGVRDGNEIEFINLDLIPVLSSMRSVRRWVDVNFTLSSRSPSVIKIDTGMTRLGISLSDLHALCGDEKELKSCNPVLFMSHLACADDPTHPLNFGQQQRFANCIETIRNVMPSASFSLANSSGVFLGPLWHFDLVRPGAALYGLAPRPKESNPMESVVSLSLPIIQIRTLSEPASVGYGAEALLAAGSRVAVVAGGYADGLNRTLGQNPQGILNGQLVHAVGRMSMDVTIFDVTAINIPDDQLMQSSVEVINDTFSANYLIQKNDALGYEVLTSLGNRYKRRYIRQGCDEPG